MRKQVTEEQKVSGVKEAQAGANVRDLCRRLGIRRETLYACLWCPPVRDAAGRALPWLSVTDASALLQAELRQATQLPACTCGPPLPVRRYLDGLL